MSDITLPFEIAPHPKRGAKEQGSERIVVFAAEIRAASESSDERPIIEITSTSTGEDRHGSTIIEWDDATFMRTGHVLWQHDVVPALPYVGKKLARRQDGERSISTIELLVGAWRHIEPAYGNLPAFLWETFKSHQMGAISRAFIPKKWKARRATTVPDELAENVEYSLVEQTEESFVNVPSNRDSFARAIARRRDAGNFNEQLARMLGYEIEPIVLDTSKESDMPTRTVESFRADLESVMARCGCDTYREPKPEAVSEDEKAADIAAMTAVVTSQLASLDAALSGWRATSQNNLRGVFSGIAVSAMYTIEGLIWRAKEWYGEDLAITVPELTEDELERIAAPPQGRMFGRSADVQPATDAPRSLVRTRFAELLRCCGCDPYEEPVPALPAEETVRANEIGILRAIADESLVQIETAMAGWKTAETERLRQWCSDRVFGAMWAYDMSSRYLSRWYGEQIDSVPNVDLDEVQRALHGVTLLDVMQRMAGPFDYASTQVNLEGDEATKILELGSTLIPDEALAEKGRETSPHVTVKFGIDPSIDAAAVFEVIENSDTIKEIAARGATMTLGATAVFADDEYDVVHIAVDSPDLVRLNEIIAEALSATDTQPKYVPHVTLAYVQSGRGQDFAGDETLAGTEIRFDSIVFSDTDGNETVIPLSGEGLEAYDSTTERSKRSVRRKLYLRIGAVFSKKNLAKIDQIIELAQDLRSAANKPTADDLPDDEGRAIAPPTPVSIRIKDTGDVTNEQVTEGHSIRVLVPEAAAGRAADDPTSERPLYFSLLKR